MARLLHLGEITAVTVPFVAQESARDLVRAREDCRADLMRTRHRLSKLLLRQGIVYYGGKAWTGTHERWLRQQRFAELGQRLAYDEAFDAMLVTRDRRDRLDAAITAMAKDLRVQCGGPPRPGCLRGGIYAHRVRAGHRDRRLAALHRPLYRRLSRTRADRGFLGGDPGSRAA